jgi:hypothetical protein
MPIAPIDDAVKTADASWIIKKSETAVGNNGSC